MLITRIANQSRFNFVFTVFSQPMRNQSTKGSSAHWASHNTLLDDVLEGLLVSHAAKPCILSDIRGGRSGLGRSP